MVSLSFIIVEVRDPDFAGTEKNILEDNLPFYDLTEKGI